MLASAQRQRRIDARRADGARPVHAFRGAHASDVASEAAPARELRPRGTRRKFPRQRPADKEPLKPGIPGIEALAAAAGGTLCVEYKLPDDFDDVVSALSGPIARALLIVCAHALPRGNDIASPIVSVVRSILIPVRRRGHLRFRRRGMTSADREWVVNNASDSLHQLEMAIRRIVALHACGESVTQASKLQWPS